MRRSWQVAVCLFLLLPAAAPVQAFVDIPISTGPRSQLFPVVSGDLVVWSDSRDGYFDVYGRFLSEPNEFAITTSQESAVGGVDGGLVVWTDSRGGTGDVYGRDVPLGSEFAISTGPSRQAVPAVSGKYVVWRDDRDSPPGVPPEFMNDDIYGVDLQTGQEVPLCTNLSDQVSPKISGNLVVWQDGRNRLFTEWDIYGYDLSTGQELTICNEPLPQAQPDISGNIVVWTDYRSGFADIWGKDLSTGIEFPICTDAAEQTQPAIDGNLIVWTDMRNSTSSNPDIYGYDLLTHTEFPICLDPSEQGAPRISGGLVVWYDMRNGDPDIYGAYIPEPATGLLLAAGALVMSRRGRQFAD